MNNEEILKENNGKKFDICLMNPPYANRLHHRFLEKVIDIGHKIISIQPTSWILATNKDKRIINKLSHYTNLETVNGIQSFDAAFINNSIGIVYINNDKEFNIIINDIKFNDFDNIKNYSLDRYLVEFKEYVGEVKESLWDNIKFTTEYYKQYEDNPNDDWWIIKISELRGNTTSNEEVYSSDFYTLISKDVEFLKNNKGQFKKISKIPNRKGKYDFGYFAFDTEYELNNFINYIKTDFCRSCLKLSKIHNNQFRGCMKTIPWFDFSDEHFSKSPREIDDWLFKKYNISDKIREHIEEILPDYYNIRGNS